MKPEHFFITKTGEIKLLTVELPVEPEPPHSWETKGGLKIEVGGDFGYDKAYSKYKSALQSLFTDPEKSVLVSNYGKVFCEITNKYHVAPIPKETIYSLECEVEIRTRVYSGVTPFGSYSEQLALITFPEQKPTPIQRLFQSPKSWHV